MVHASGFDHITVTVSDIRISESFYDRLMKFMGLKKAFSEYGFAGWSNEDFKFYISAAQLPYRTEKYVKYRPGLHHLAFLAQKQEDVDHLYQFLLKQKIKVLNPPSILKQGKQDMYFVSFEDPDGIKLEFAYPIHRKSRQGKVESRQ